MERIGRALKRMPVPDGDAGLLTPALRDAARAKVGALCRGVRIPAETEARLRERAGGDPLTLADYATTSGVTLRLPGEVWVNAPFAEHNPNFVGATPWCLEFQGDALVLTDGATCVPAIPVPVPAYHDRRNRWDEPYTSYAITHSDRVRISPVEGCGIVCRFCDLPFTFAYRRKPIAALVDSVACALADEVLPARHVLISGGTPRPADHAYLREVYRAVATAFPRTPVDVMMVPVPGLLDVDELHALRIHELSINVEIVDAELARRVMPQKARIGFGGYLAFIESAVERWGRGRVRSLLLVGIEPPESTLRGVEELARRGCAPVLSPFRPDPATPMSSHAPPDEALLWDVWRRSVEICARHGVSLGPRCVPCQHNTLTFPEPVVAAP